MALLPAALRSLFTRSSSRITENETPTVAEISAIPKSSLQNLFLGDTLPNPDEVLKFEAGGKSYDLYRKMLKKDARIADLLRTRVIAIESTAWNITPFIDTAAGAINATPDAEAQADLIKRMFELDDGSKLRRLISISYRDSLAQGFSVDESIFGYDAQTQKFIISQFKPRKAERFGFNDDWEAELRGSFLEGFQTKTLDQWRFVIFRNGGGAENPYGDAICQELYWLFYFKKEIIKFWATYLERFGTPILDIEFKADLKSNKELAAQIEEMADTYINATAVQHPDDVKLSLLEATRSGEGTYDAFVRWADQQFAKSIIGQTLTTSEGDRSGSLALSKTHGTVAQSVLERDCASIEAVLNQQVIKPTVDLNWADVPGYPRLRFDCRPAEDLKNKADYLEIIQRMGLPIPTEFAQDSFSIPAPIEGEEILEKAQPLALPGIGGDEGDPLDPATKQNGTRRTAAAATATRMSESDSEYLEFSIAGRASQPQSNTRILKRYRKLSGPGIKFLHAPGERDPYAVSFSEKRVAVSEAIEFMSANFADFAGKLPPPGTPQVGITSTFHLHDPFRKRILAIFDTIRPDLANLLETDAALLAATEQLIRRNLPFPLSPDLAIMNDEAIIFAVESMASQLALTITPDKFNAYQLKYLDLHAFKSTGTISEVADEITFNVTKSLTSRARSPVKKLASGEMTLAEATTELTRQFDDMAEWKARQIAISEVNNAANWASIQVVRDTGQDWLGWFMVDPLSCSECLEQAARNPYKLHEAELLGLPHPNCNDFWSFTLRGEVI